MVEDDAEFEYIGQIWIIGNSTIRHHSQATGGLNTAQSDLMWVYVPLQSAINSGLAHWSMIPRTPRSSNQSIATIVG